MSEPLAQGNEPTLACVPDEVYADAAFCRKYLLERELGVGGAGVVVCARHRELDERVAIKFLLSGPDNRDAIARFRREARAANRVKDEHVVRIIDVATTETDVPYVVMEYLDGIDLERMLQQTPDRQLPVRDAIEFVLQACEALAECHAIGIVHRDLKPSNLFCTHGADGLPIIKVLDFGISKLGPTTVDGAMTGKHAIIGSPRYMSPEQFSTPADVDHRTDIWALGVILYEVVTGVAPFVGDTLFGIWERVKSEVPKPMAGLRRDAPKSLGPVIERCLEKDRAQRFQNVAELAKALLPFAPERCRGSVARIVRIVESPGVSTASLSLPLSDSAPGSTATSVSIRSAAHATKPRRAAFVVLSLLAAAVVGAVVVREASRAPKVRTVAESAAEAATIPANSEPAPVKVEPVAPAPVTAEAAAPERASASPAAPSATSKSPSTPRTVPTVSTPTVPTAAIAAAAARPNPTTTTAPARPAAAAPAPSASTTAAPSVTARAASSGTPWIVDIVETRKAKSGEVP